MKMIIDTDPGIDDAMAIFYAHAAPEIELVGLTTVFGNVRVDQATRNALRLVEKMGLDIPVAEGAGQPRALPPFPPSAYVHGDEGFGDIPAETPKGHKAQESAAEFLCRMAREHKGELVVAPVGPLTNIAAAMDNDPEFATNVAHFAVMGGSLGAGNINEFAEANIYHDPHAAEVVFNSGANVTMVGLDITNKVTCRAEDFAALAKASPDFGGMLEEMAVFYLKFYKEFGLDGCGLHDPAAVIAATHPELFDVEEVGITVTCEGEAAGQTRRGDGPSIRAVAGGQAQAIKALWMERIATLP